MKVFLRRKKTAGTRLVVGPLRWDARTPVNEVRSVEEAYAIASRFPRHLQVVVERPTAPQPDEPPAEDDVVEAVEPPRKDGSLGTDGLAAPPLGKTGDPLLDGDDGDSDGDSGRQSSRPGRGRSSKR